MSQHDDRPPVAKAVEWVSRITTVGLVMALPAIAGHWLDDRGETQHWGLVGVLVGLTVGMWYLLRMTSVVGKGKQVNSEQLNSEQLNSEQLNSEQLNSEQLNSERGKGGSRKAKRDSGRGNQADEPPVRKDDEL